MFKKSMLEESIEKLLEEMQGLDPSTTEYSRCADQVVKLTEALEKQSGAKAKIRDAAIVSGTNLVGILAIANYERVGVWTTNAFKHALKK